MNRETPLTKEMIDQIFDKANVQHDYLFGLYRVAVPEFDEVKQLLGYPKVSKTTVEYIWQKAIAFDKVFHPDVQAGGCWMNSGFEYDNEMSDWVVIVDTDIIIMRDENEQN